MPYVLRCARGPACYPANSSPNLAYLAISASSLPSNHLKPLSERPAAAPQATLVGDEVVHVASNGDGQAVVDGRLALAEIWTRLYRRSV